MGETLVLTDHIASEQKSHVSSEETSARKITHVKFNSCRSTGNLNAFLLMALFFILSVTPLAFAEDDFFTTLFGSAKTSSDDGLFYGFGTVSVDNDGNVFVADTAKYRIQKFSPDGQFLAKWGSAGIGDGQFVSPGRVAFDSDGNAYVSDRLSHSVQKFTGTGEFIAKWGGGNGLEKNDGSFINPQYIAVDSEDNVYVSDADNRRIQKFSSDGNFLVKWNAYDADVDDPNIPTPHILSIDSEDSIYVADMHRIQKFSSDGQLISKWDTYYTMTDELPNAFVVAIDFSGNSYALDSQQRTMTKFSPDGVILSSQASPSLVTPESMMRFSLGMTFDRSDNLYAFDMVEFDVKKFDGDGNIIASFGKLAERNTDDPITSPRILAPGEISSPGILAVDSMDNVYVENYNQILKFSSDGKLIARMNLVDADFVNDGGGNDNIARITHLTNIVFDSHDNMYVSNEQSKIFKFTNDGKLIKKYKIFRTSAFDSFVGIALDSKDNIYAFNSDGNKDDIIQKFTNNGDLIATWEHCRDRLENERCELKPTAIVADHNDDIYVAYYPSHIQKFSSEGEFMAEWKSAESGSGQFVRVPAMAVDSENNVYVIASFSDKIMQFAPDGELITEWGYSGSGEGQFLGITGIAIDSENNVYASDKRNDRIQKFPKDSIFITKEGDAPPAANAGKDQHVGEGTQITLDGTKSQDPDKTIPDTGGMPEQIRFEWKQTGGPFAILSDNTIANPVVDVPIIDEKNAVLSFELTVTDYVGVSDSDAVEIHVKANSSPESNLSEPVNLSDNDEANSINASITTYDNFVYVLWNESTVDSTELLLKVSDDGGTTFQDATRVWKTPNPISNISVMSSGNNVYAEWTEGGSYGVGSWFIASSNDHGKNFSRPMIFSDTGLSPDFLVSKDNVYVAWMPINQDTGARDTIHLKASNNAGKRFTEQTLHVSEKSIGEVKLSSSEDKIHLVWSNSDGTQKGHTYYMQSTDKTGKTFTVPLEIATDAISVDSVMVYSNDIYVLVYTEESAETPSRTYSYGKISVLQSSDGGKSFTEILASDDPAMDGGAKYYRNRVLSVSENNIYVTWSEYGLKKGKLYAMSSSDGGKTFAKTFVDNASYLTFGPDQTSFDDKESLYKMTSSGQDVSLVYHSPIKSGDDIRSFLVNSNDSGKTFEKRIRLGNAVEGYSEFFPRIASSSDGTIHATWISGKIDLPLPTDADTFYSGIGNAGKDLIVQSFQIHASPLKQIKSGISTDKIQCKESLTLVVKHDGFPACVKESSVSKFIERGWVKVPQNSLS